MYLTQSLHRALQQLPDRAMTIDGDRIRTAREVADRVARLAGALRAAGVDSGDRVAILALNSAHHHECFFASWWAGAVAHPINTRWSPAEIAYALSDSGTEVLLLGDAFATLGPELRERAPGLRTLIYCGDGPTPEGMVGYEELIAGAAPVPDARRGGDDLAFLLYTGGTTGKPKGVMITHQAFMTSVLGMIAAGHKGLRKGGVAMLTAPLFHVGALLSWYGQSLVGGTGVFLPAFTPERVFEAVQRHRVTTFALVPAMVQRLCEHPDFASYDLSSIENIGYGAAGAPESLLHQAMNAFPDANFTQVYGMTETGVLTFLGGEHREGGPRLRSAGRAIPVVEIAVVDMDGSQLPAGEIGEVVTRGDHVMAGYWNQPELTVQTIRDGWMHTGDGGYLDEDGYLYIVDRLKDMIITGGENVYSAEVENALSSHPAVSSCAVIGVPDEEWGERVHAVIVLRPDCTSTAEEIRAYVKTLIAGYKAPRTVTFVDAMPLSATGKILKRELRSAATRR